MFLQIRQGATASLKVNGGGASLLIRDAVAALREKAGEQVGYLERVEPGVEKFVPEATKVVVGKLLEVHHAGLDADYSEKR